MKIKVCFAAEKKPDFPSRMIMRRNGLGVSHALIKFYCLKDKRWKIVHSIGEGVCVAEIDEFMKEHIITREVEVNLLCCAQFFQGFIEGSKGKGYSKGQILNIIFGFKAFRNGKALMICSEFVGRIIDDFSSITLLGNPDDWDVQFLWWNI